MHGNFIVVKERSALEHLNIWQRISVQLQKEFPISRVLGQDSVTKIKINPSKESCYNTR
jgi:hypothetical protein